MLPTIIVALKVRMVQRERLRISGGIALGTASICWVVIVVSVSVSLLILAAVATVRRFSDEFYGLFDFQIKVPF